MGVGQAREQPPIPQFVGRYEVLVPIASGGMATVYLARSRGAGGFAREVALKLTHLHLRESQEFESLLLEEAKLASSIRHQNVVSVLDVGDDPLGLFLVMDYVEGDTLSGLLRRARNDGLPLERGLAMRILQDALAGLHAAHDTCDGDGRPLHLVHRDFSPQNILVGTDGVTKLTDFGIAKAASRAGNTSTGILKGKIAYMSPEQAKGSPLDRRADVWAAGVLAWEIVTGRSLWPRDQEDVSTLIKLVTTPPPRLRELDPGVSEALDETVAKALSMEPGDRWPTAEAFAKALAAASPAGSVEDLAAAVRALAGPKLEHRRAQVRSMGALRAKMGEITEASVMTPSGMQPRVPSRPIFEDPDESDATEILAEPPVMRAPSPPAEPGLERRKKAGWLAPVAAVAIVALGVATLALAGRRPSAQSTKQVATATNSAEPRPEPAASEPSATATPTVPTGVATGHVVATAPATGTGAPTPTPTVVPRGPVARPRALARRPDGDLATGAEPVLIRSPGRRASGFRVDAGR